MEDRHTRPSKKVADFIESFNSSPVKITIDFNSGFVNFDCDMCLSTEIKCHASDEEDFDYIINAIISSIKKRGFAN